MWWVAPTLYLLFSLLLTCILFYSTSECTSLSFLAQLHEVAAWPKTFQLLQCGVLLYQMLPPLPSRTPSTVSTTPLLICCIWKKEWNGAEKVAWRRKEWWPRVCCDAAVANATLAHHSPLLHASSSAPVYLLRQPPQSSSPFRLTMEVFLPRETSHWIWHYLFFAISKSKDMFQRSAWLSLFFLVLETLPLALPAAVKIHSSALNRTAPAINLFRLLVLRLG